MAAVSKKICESLLFLNKNGMRCVARISRPKMLSSAPRNNFSTLALSGRSQQRIAKQLIVGVSGTLLGAYIWNNYGSDGQIVNAKSDEKEARKEYILSRREQRFHDFASCELNGQVVMTPYDFIESLIENKPKLSRRGKIRITEKDLRRIKKRTPSIERGSTTFFRDLHQDGIITYSEYLFLVTILTKSNAGLKTALKMMDVNGDKQINVEEFQLIERMINESASCSTCYHHSHNTAIQHSVQMQTIPQSGEDNHSNNIPQTTVYLHLFGADGQNVVTFEEFFKFMDDLQSEVLELEFHEYSKSMKYISEVDFGKILLRNTTLTEQEYCEYIDRLMSRISSPRGVSMEQFKAFNTFLSNIEDFIIAVNMTNVSGQDVDKDLFKRAVQVTTGEDIDQYIIDVVFILFDVDGDGKLSQNEFIGIMKDRLKRGFGKFPNLTGFRGFKHCLKKEMVKSAD